MADRTDEQQVYVERWEQALRVLESMTEHEREKHFDMSDWGKKTDCGTVACLAGHCSLDPWFIARGFVSQFVQTAHFSTGEQQRILRFTRFQPDDFFGDIGDDRVFMRTGASYEETVVGVRKHIQYLKDGGLANEPPDDEDDYYDGEDDDNGQ